MLEVHWNDKWFAFWRAVLCLNTFTPRLHEPSVSHKKKNAFTSGKNEKKEWYLASLTLFFCYATLVIFLKLD